MASLTQLKPCNIRHFGSISMVNKRMAPAAALCLCLLGSVTHAQGVPVIDGTNLAKNIQQLKAALRDAENQIAQIEELKNQVENGLEQITNLEGILGSISGLNEIASLYNSAQDLRSRAAKITDLSSFTDAIAIGDFASLRYSLLDGQVTIGDKMAAEYMEDTLASAGLSSEVLAGLSSSENPQDKRIAETAAASATAMGVAQLSYEEAAQSGERPCQRPDRRELGGRTGQGKELLRLFGGKLMRRDVLLAAVAAVTFSLTGFVGAEDLSTVSDVDLLKQTREAVGVQDADLALELLTEMQRRGTGIFTGAEKVACEESIDTC